MPIKLHFIWLREREAEREGERAGEREREREGSRATELLWLNVIIKAIGFKEVYITQSLQSAELSISGATQERKEHRVQGKSPNMRLLS